MARQGQGVQPDGPMPQMLARSHSMVLGHYLNGLVGSLSPKRFGGTLKHRMFGHIGKTSRTCALERGPAVTRTGWASMASASAWQLAGSRAISGGCL
eukprot:3717595-Amphidinium_carterae.2